MSTGNASRARVVGIGGGHGLAATLRAATSYAGDLAGIVSVADDGGSSGRLRDATGLPAMGDIRRCLSSLADRSTRLGEILEYRFTGDLDGHAFGNLLIVALAERMGFTGGIAELTRLVGAPANIRPVTETAVVLLADTDDGPVRGQVAVQQCRGIKRVALEPVDAPAAPGVVEAIAAADQIVLGPGSLYTSVLAALVLPPIREAVASSTAQIVYVCNLREQLPETKGYDVAAHAGALHDHGVEPDVVVCHPEALPAGRLDVEVLSVPVARPHGLAHDPELLGAALSALLGRA
jgi:uncharacterized cofD-like protein